MMNNTILVLQWRCEAMTNEQLAIRIQAGIDVSDNMLQLWQQNRGFIYKLVNQYKTYAEEDDLEQ